MEPTTRTVAEVETLSPERARAAIEAALVTPEAGHIPTSSYRVQFNEAFSFADAERWATYIQRLGVGALYTSPYFHARSTHGYDIIDHTKVNPSLGDEQQFGAMFGELKRLGMGHIMDVVPNHMGIGGGGNQWWHDVLENGEASLYADYFDIDWQPLNEEMQHQVLLPVLGHQYGRSLELGELQVEFREGAFFLRYYDLLLPIAPGSYAPLLRLARDHLVATLEPEHPAVIELESVLTAISHLPSRIELDPERQQERQREKEVIKRRLARLTDEEPAVLRAVEAAVEAFNGVPGDPHSFDQLDALLSVQPYRLAYWRVAAEEINYRRFFDINELAAIRMELPEVFRATHDLVMRLIGEGMVTGLRIDHPDGLWAPARYFAALQLSATVARAQAILEAELGPLPEADQEVLEAAAADAAHVILRSLPLYVVVEKILSRGEELPEDWAVHGTTGYDFLNSVGGLFVDGSNERAITEIYERFTGESFRYDDLVYASKHRILRTALASELAVLAHSLNRLAERNRLYRDFTLGNLQSGLREVIAAFPVYRTYVTEEIETVDRRDRAAVEAAVRQAVRRRPDIDISVFDFLRNVLLLDLPELGPEDRAAQREFVMRLQQLTGPVMAKGLEDTTFYIYNRLISLNEVGGEPQHFGTSPTVFHHENLQRCRRAPHSMLATSTHDTKRSEDVRARISVLSEVPEEWESALQRWHEHNLDKKQLLEGSEVPSRNEEYFFYQTLLGVWPLDGLDGAQREEFTARVTAYMTKALREAKVNSSWINQNQEYESAVDAFVRAVLDDEGFVALFKPLQEKVAYYGAINSLSQIVLKFASPGVPDIYQGNETWRLSLVDPDNRRPVGYEAHARLLSGLEEQAQGTILAMLASDLMEQWRDGRVKLWVTYKALTHRRKHPNFYREADYLPLESTGPAAEHLMAFARNFEEESVVAAVPRLVTRLVEATEERRLRSSLWAGTTVRVADGVYRNLFTGERIKSRAGIPADELFASFPVALLQRESSE